MNKTFPINETKLCLLKLAWSSIYIYHGTSNSCHRTAWDPFENNNVNTFHNTSEKIKSREEMLANQWPADPGCQYCKNTEEAGGMSDRLYSWQHWLGTHGNPAVVPKEIDIDYTATITTPTMIEAYFSNKCNMKCIYCGPSLSSLWVAEEKKFSNSPLFDIKPLIDAEAGYQERLNQFWLWLDKNYQSLVVFNVLGGEPFYQEELDICLDFFQQRPANTKLDFSVFSNLKVEQNKFKQKISLLKDLYDDKKFKTVAITASLDCWGQPAEYIRTGLELTNWQENFEYLINECPWIKITINSTINGLSIKTMPDLLKNILLWNEIRIKQGSNKIINSFNLLTEPPFMAASNFPVNYFNNDFEKILNLYEKINPDKLNYLKGLFMSVNNQKRIRDLTPLIAQLNIYDSRRKTSWPDTFPWLKDLSKR